MSDPKTKNRRSSDRWPADTYAALTFNSPHYSVGDAFGAVVNVSSGGMRVRTPQPPVRFMKLVARIALGEVTYEVPCKCTWVVKAEKGGYEVGLMFDPPSEQATVFVQAFESWKPD